MSSSRARLRRGSDVFKWRLNRPGLLPFLEVPVFSNFHFSPPCAAVISHIVRSLYYAESHVLISCFLARDRRAFANEGTIRMASGLHRSSPHLLALRAVTRCPQTPRAAVSTTSASSSMDALTEGGTMSRCHVTTSAVPYLSFFAALVPVLSRRLKVLCVTPAL